MSGLPTVREALAAAGITADGHDAEMLAGGDNSTAWRVRRPDGSAVVVKAFGKLGRDGTAAPDDLFEVEAEGLAALRIGLAWPSARVPDRFFEAYAERRPIADGWRERVPLLHLRELRSLIAHRDSRRDHVADVRRIIRAFR